MRGMCGRKGGKAKLLCGGLIKPNLLINHIINLVLITSKLKRKKAINIEYLTKKQFGYL